MEIEYVVGNAKFDTREKAEEYLNTLKKTMYLMVYTNPDLKNGHHGCTTANIFKVKVVPERKFHQTNDNLIKLVYNAVGERIPKIAGVMGTIQLMNNFRVKVLDEDEIRLYSSGYKNVQYKPKFELHEIPYEYEAAMEYVRNVLSPLLEKIGGNHNE